jgi:NitT/TauT family transport system permease protein
VSLDDRRAGGPALVETALAPARPLVLARSIWKRIAVPLGIGVVWEGAARAGLIDPFFLPPLTRILATLVETVRTGEFFDHLVPSLSRALRGYLLAGALAVPLGFLFGWSRRVREYAGSVVEVLRPIPPISLIPVAILWLGIGDLSKVGIIAWACFWPIFLNSILGVQSISPVLVKSARIMEIRGLAFFVKILLPAALPQVFTGFRISLAISLIVLVAAEMVGADRGLGYLILEAERTFRAPLMFVGIFTIAVVGYLLNELILALERHLFRYREDIA